MQHYNNPGNNLTMHYVNKINNSGKTAHVTFSLLLVSIKLCLHYCCATNLNLDVSMHSHNKFNPINNSDQISNPNPNYFTLIFHLHYY